MTNPPVIWFTTEPRNALVDVLGAQIDYVALLDDDGAEVARQEYDRGNNVTFIVERRCTARRVALLDVFGARLGMLNVDMDNHHLEIGQHVILRFTVGVGV